MPREIYKSGFAEGVFVVSVGYFLWFAFTPVDAAIFTAGGATAGLFMTIYNRVRRR